MKGYNMATNSLIKEQVTLTYIPCLDGLKYNALTASEAVTNNSIIVVWLVYPYNSSSSGHSGYNRCVSPVYYNTSTNKVVSQPVSANNYININQDNKVLTRGVLITLYTSDGGHLGDITLEDNDIPNPRTTTATLTRKVEDLIKAKLSSMKIAPRSLVENATEVVLHDKVIPNCEPHNADYVTPILKGAVNLNYITNGRDHILYYPGIHNGSPLHYIPVVDEDINVYLSPTSNSSSPKLKINTKKARIEMTSSSILTLNGDDILNNNGTTVYARALIIAEDSNNPYYALATGSLIGNKSIKNGFPGLMYLYGSTSDVYNGFKLTPVNTSGNTINYSFARTTNYGNGRINNLFFSTTSGLSNSIKLEVYKIDIDEEIGVPGWHLMQYGADKYLPGSEYKVFSWTYNRVSNIAIAIAEYNQCKDDIAKFDKIINGYKVGSSIVDLELAFNNIKQHLCTNMQNYTGSTGYGDKSGWCLPYYYRYQTFTNLKANQFRILEFDTAAISATNPSTLKSTLDTYIKPIGEYTEIYQSRLRVYTEISTVSSIYTTASAKYNTAKRSPTDQYLSELKVYQSMLPETLPSNQKMRVDINKWVNEIDGLVAYNAMSTLYQQIQASPTEDDARTLNEYYTRVVNGVPSTDNKHKQAVAWYNDIIGKVSGTDILREELEKFRKQITEIHTENVSSVTSRYNSIYTLGVKNYQDTKDLLSRRNTEVNEFEDFISEDTRDTRDTSI